MAISIMIHISNLGALGYSVLQKQPVGCLVCRMALQLPTCCFVDMQSVWDKRFQHLLKIMTQSSCVVTEDCSEERPPAHILDAAAVQRQDVLLDQDLL